MIVLPGYIAEIIERKLKRKIISFESLSHNPKLKSYTILTDKGYLSLRSSRETERIEIEVNGLELMRTKGTTCIPKIIYHDTVEYKKQPLFLLVEEIYGSPLNSAGLTIFSYNKVLAQLAEILVGLHDITLYRYGTLGPSLVGSFYTWNSFLVSSLEKELDVLREHKIFPSTIMKRIQKSLHFRQDKISSSLLHGHIASGYVYIDKNLHIATVSNFVYPVSGDPNWELAGFLLYDGLDRARRLVNCYYLLGGFVEWDSEDLLKTALRRSAQSLSYELKIAGPRIERRRDILLQVLSKM